MQHKRPKFCMNDHIDILIEILQKLDGPSLSIAACVCRLWCTIATNDSIWENLCFRHVHPLPSGVRHVVVALGGYKKLYMLCVRPVLSRLGRAWTSDDVQLSLSLFCVDYYERLGNASAQSLMFLYRTVNV